MKRNYEKLDITVFGRHLLDSKDLDPIYVALWGLLKCEEGFTLQQTQRWLVAYWCYYHAGVACRMSELEGGEFWGEMATAAENTRLTPHGERWPRGHERRHFRGQFAVNAVAKLKAAYPEPEAMVQRICEAGHDFQKVSNRVREHLGFGPWISFKVCDMLDRVLEHRVDFTQAAVFMFDDPVEAALMLWRERAGLAENVTPKDRAGAINAVVEYLKAEFASQKAPPVFDRPVDLQEVETILCKWKSHRNGHYPLWNDVDEIRQGLSPWCEGGNAASKFLRQMPKREVKI